MEGGTMRVEEMRFGAVPPVDGYGPGFFRIGGIVRQGPVLILPSGVAVWGGWDDTAPILAEAAALDLLFVGTGAEPAWPPEAFRTALEAAGIGVETMATPPACRSFNVVLAEGRRAGAALVPV